MKVFAIVVTYNGRKWYDICFNSILQTNIPIEIIVIDNASSDGSPSYIQTKFPSITLISASTNLGFGQANNIGIQYAITHNADYVFLLNQDAWIEPNTISELIQIHMQHTDFGLVSCLHLNREKNIVWQFEDVCHSALLHNTFANDMYFNRLKDIYETTYVNAAAWLIPISTIKRIGGFDPIFFHYGEDDNYLNRIIYHGLKIGICPKLTIIHDMNIKSRPLYDSREQKILLLIEYTNINYPLRINVERLTQLRKVITSLARNRKLIAKEHYARYKFLTRNRTAILHSRTTNATLGCHWINNAPIHCE